MNFFQLLLKIVIFALVLCLIYLAGFAKEAHQSGKYFTIEYAPLTALLFRAMVRNWAGT